MATEASNSTSLSIAEAARVTGLSAYTLRYYEQAGLMLGPVERTSSTHRRYTEQDVAWLILLTRLRRTGMPVREMRRFAALVRAGEGTEAKRLALLQQHRRAVLDRIEEMQRNLEQIDRKIDLYLESVATQGEAANGAKAGTGAS